MPRHHEIDHHLRAIAKRRVGLEVEEARWLREAERLQIWRKLGYSTALEYLEDVFGYSPRTAKDRLRVARELGTLPALETELRNGALPYSAARELTRVMTPVTESAWLARARGRNLRDIEDLVAGHAKGDGPDAPKNPDLMTRRVTFELTPRVAALLQQARAMFEDERGESIDDIDLLESLCKAALAGTTASTSAPRPAHQIIVRSCDVCSRVLQEGKGRLIELGPAERELIECDAEIIREADIVAAASAGTRRPPPTLTIPKKTRDLVWIRDGGRCRVPGCRATRHLAFHHLEHRAHGGDHSASNLILLCDGHHKALHDGLLTITGAAPDKLVFTRNGNQLVDARSPEARTAARELHAVRKHAPQRCGEDARSGHAHQGAPCAGPGARSRFADVVRFEEAKQALMQLGFRPRAARQALDAACAHVGTDASTAALVEQALALTRPDPGAEPTTQTAELVGDPAMRAMAKQALMQSGYSAGVAERAVDAARAHVGTNADLAALIFEAFKRCATV